MSTTGYISLKDLEIYSRSRELSRLGWGVFSKFRWQVRKIVGDQFIRALDSIGANIAEGYGRFHYLDRVRFYYNARASLLESIHWVELLEERDLITKQTGAMLKERLDKLHLKLNNFISTTLKAKKDDGKGS